MANEGGGGWHSELIASRQTSSGDGRKWYHVLYVLERQEETAYLREEAFIRAKEMRAEGKQVLIAAMAKNRRFQKEQLEAEGYEEIIEVYERPLG